MLIEVLHTLYVYKYIYIYIHLEIKLNIISINHTIRQVPHRKRLILGWSCHHSRLGHTSDIHSYSYSRCQVLPPSSNFTDISCWAGLHLQFFLCVNLFSDNWPSWARRCSDESSRLPGQCCTSVTVWCSGLVVLCLVLYPILWPFALNHAETTTVHKMVEHQSVLPVDQHIWGIVFPVCI